MYITRTDPLPPPHNKSLDEKENKFQKPRTQEFRVKSVALIIKLQLLRYYQPNVSTVALHTQYTTLLMMGRDMES